MNRLFFNLFPWALALAVILVPAPGRFHAKAYAVAMVTWRGETIAENGFIQELDKSLLDIAITKYHADQDEEKLKAVITQIQRTPVDLIYVFGTIATKTVPERIKHTPMVFNIVSWSIGSGIIAS
ncbi:MAG: hypothetical protein KKE44_00785 [Proteobacteria bacterium]|nr:hypothetical protein [Pseudomonadota bacterium]MBU1581263.1 hypothetical protein [Pseudomonadota bacterium]MBU2455085.1 hypothetical protein [Pseudomonadota bacterium]MBU2627132.1 hypothetical protein [Pseudomonadota bacterium]